MTTTEPVLSDSKKIEKKPRAGAAASAVGELHLVGKALGSDPGDSGARRATANQPPTGQTDEPVSERTSRQLRPRTSEDIANEQTAEQLALRIWSAIVAEKVLSDMSVLVDELLDSHLLDDDDEEGDESWLDDHHKREKKLLDEAIADRLDKYPDINAINNEAAKFRS